MRRYHVQNRDDYHAYNKICGQVRRLSHLLSRLPPADPFRTKYEDMLLSKLYDMGILDRGAKMSDIEGSDAPVVKGFKGKEKEVEGAGKKEGKVTVGAMCRRRLAVVMVRLKMAETVKMVSGPRFATLVCTCLIPVLAPGRHLCRTGTCPRRSRYDHRSGVPRHQKHGRLCHLGRHFQDQASRPEVQREFGSRVHRARAISSSSSPACRTNSTTSISWREPAVFSCFPPPAIPYLFVSCMLSLSSPPHCNAHSLDQTRRLEEREKRGVVMTTTRHSDFAETDT